MNTGWNFTMRQRRGLLVLTALLVCIVVGRGYWKMRIEDNTIAYAPPSHPDETQRSIFYPKKDNSDKKRVSFSPKKTKPQPASIDLNTTTYKELATLPGIGPTFSKRIVKFRDAMGGFDSIAQLKKVYGLPPETYAALEEVFYLGQPFDYAQGEVQGQAQDSSSSFKRKYKSQDADKTSQRSNSKPSTLSAFKVTDLNTADSAALDALPGIGPVLSKRIIRFRKRLGYFAYPEIVKLVYGFSEENYQKALPWLKVAATDKPAISLKSATWNDLKTFPFLDKRMISIILKKQQSGTVYRNWDEVAAIPGMDAQTLKWLRGYVEL